MIVWRSICVFSNEHTFETTLTDTSDTHNQTKREKDGESTANSGRNRENGQTQWVGNRLEIKGGAKG